MHTNPIVYKDVEFLFSMGLNWTFMELKLLILLIVNQVKKRLNWTFMELKLRKDLE